MTKVPRDILSLVERCPKCGATYYQGIEPCRCPVEEPRVVDWEDPSNPLVEAHKQ